MPTHRALIQPKPNVDLRKRKLDPFEASMQDEGPDDPLAPARGCFIHGPWMGLLLWGVIGALVAWWFW